MTIPPLNQVQSFDYIIASNAGELAVQQAIGASSAQMVLVGDGVGSYNLNRSIADPNNNKIILGYIDASEANLNVYPQLVAANGALPSWFGGKVFNNQYTVQYWTPAWETAVFGEIDKIAKAGYNGIFIDQVSGYLQFQTGNPYGNANDPNAVAQMATFITDIRNHINSSAFHAITAGKPFYVVGNNPDQVAVSYPTTVAHAFDGIFQELLYYNPSYIGTDNADYVSNTLAPVYKTIGLPVFGNDYPPAGNVAAEFTSFAFYTALGWNPSADSATQTTSILSTGPYEAMATAGNTTVTGVANEVNFLSGGLQTSAKLTGGNLGDYFIGGPGQNTIIAGGGNDTIYAHPVTARYLSALEFNFAAQSIGAAGDPQIQIKVNGYIVKATTLSDVSGATHELDVSVAGFGTIKSIEVDALNVSYTSSSNYNVVYLDSVAYNNKPIAASSGVLNANAHLSGPTISFSKNGVATWSGSAIPAAPAIVSTSDTIDGGAGTNTVVYRGDYSEYTITKNSNGALYLVSKDTAEGPDTLTNVQYLQFADQTIATSSIAGPTTTHLFTLPTSAVPTIQVTSASTINGTISAPAAGDAYVNGGVNAHTIYGGSGDDTFVVFKGLTALSVPVSAGIDTVLFYGGNFILPANVENITLIGAGYAQAATGNSLNNILTANNFNSTLTAGTGHDILIAGTGYNLMIGGSGPDIFQFDAAPSAMAEIQKFKVGTDVLDLRGLFKSIGYTGSDPVADQHLAIGAYGTGNTQVVFDPDGSGPAHAVQIAVLDNVAYTSLHAGLDWVWH